ncbi:hypothetical protein Hte_012570 [Hypoxylon texense]
MTDDDECGGTNIKALQRAQVEIQSESSELALDIISQNGRKIPDSEKALVKHPVAEAKQKSFIAAPEVRHDAKGKMPEKSLVVDEAEKPEPSLVLQALANMNIPGLDNSPALPPLSKPNLPETVQALRSTQASDKRNRETCYYRAHEKPLRPLAGQGRQEPAVLCRCQYRGGDLAPEYGCV